MNFLARVKALGLPADEFVVIGSGLLDALGLREAADIDLVVSQRLFGELAGSGEYQTGETEDGKFLKNNMADIWTNWRPGNDFKTLKQSSLLIDGIEFVSPQFLIVRKLERGTAKDRRDVELLRNYYG